MAPALQATIGGATRLIGIVGDPIAQVKSPGSWNPRLAAAGRDAVLVPIEVPAAEFESTIAAIMRIANLDGLVFTMPFKERIIPHLAAISRRATEVGAVNAARRGPDGTWVGDMFDGLGLVGAVRGLGLDPKGLRAGLVGAGGAGSAIAYALAEAGVASLRIVDAAPDRAARLADGVSRAARRPGGPVATAAAALDLGALDLLVNASPVGMAEGDGTPLDVGGLTPATSVVDIVTRPGTALIAAAAAAGCRHAGGAAMVAAQTEAMLAFFELA